MNLTFNEMGLAVLQRQIALLQLPAGMRRRVLYRTAVQVIRDSRKRVSRQTSLTGESYPARKRRRRTHRRKMLSKLVKELAVVNNDDLNAVIGFRRIRSGLIAAKHQHGFTERIDLRSPDRRTLNGNRINSENSARFGAQAFAPASRRQAVELKILGFKWRVNGQYKPKSIAWITQNLTASRAGVIIRSMREKQGIPRQTSWNTRQPERSFLGASPDEIGTSIDSITEQIITAMRRGIA